MEKPRLKIKFKILTTSNPIDYKHSGSTGPLPSAAEVSEFNSSSEGSLLTRTSGIMKRKRGRRAGDKKGKQKKPVVTANDLGESYVTLNTEDNSVLDDIDDSEPNSATDTEALSFGTDLPTKSPNLYTDSYNNKPVGRVKVKLRTSKTLEPHHSNSNTQTQSDTDKSNPQTLSEKHGEAVEKMEDSANSLPPKQVSLSGIFYRKAGTIKIKSSRGFGSSSAVTFDKRNDKLDSPLQVHRNNSFLDSDDRAVFSLSNELNEVESSLPENDHQYNWKELSTALEVIKKVMKMDAADPFNAPVNPVALGIPDYFDIIETPMDFGTICNDLEHGHKYANAEEVYRDVQFIWDNCYKYNAKGGYILNLMKRVKKNFMKLWTAAGLYSEPSTRNSDVSADQDSSIMEGLNQDDDIGSNTAFEEASGSLDGSASVQTDVAQSNQVKVYQESHPIKQKRGRRHGIDLHKSNCLCAVCVVRRRKREREGNVKKMKQSKKIVAKLAQELKQEESSLLGNHVNVVYHSPEPHVDYDMEDQGDDAKLESPEQQGSLQSDQEMRENETEFLKKINNEPCVMTLPDDGNVNGSNDLPRAQQTPNSNDLPRAQQTPSFITQNSSQVTDDSPVQMNEVKLVVNDTSIQQKQECDELQEPTKKHLDSKVQDPPFGHENPLLQQLCGALFNNDPRSVWTGPNSLNRRRASIHNSSMHAAVSMCMKLPTD